MRLELEYKYNRLWGNPVHTWSVVGGRGGLHLHIADHGEKHAEKYGERYSGGIECHYRHPPEYLADDAPHKSCWLLGGPCWHDGSSLQATERWIPLWLSARESEDCHEQMLAALEGEYRKHFSREEVDA